MNGLDLAARVACRYVWRVQGSKALVRQALRDYREAQVEIAALLKKEDVPSAKQRFVELGVALKPLATALDGVKISRPDEQRKLKNVRMWLGRLQRAFDSVDRHEGLGDLEVYLYNTLDWIGETLKSLRNVRDRLEGYAAVEKTFRHGPWTIDNRYGYSKGEYVEPLGCLDEASQRIQAKGLGSVLYGEVRLESPQQDPGVAGRYWEASDLVLLHIGVRHRHSDVFTLVHELGHRYWHKVMSPAQRDVYEDQYSSGGLTLGQREDIYQALVKAQFRPATARKFLRDPSLPIVEFVKQFGGYGGKASENWKAYQEGHTWVERQIVRPKERYLRLDAVQVETVSEYARTNVREDYAETFASYVFGHAIPDSVMQRFAPTL